jgi:hypothetical protein
MTPRGGKLMPEVKAIKVLVDGLTFGSNVYSAGQIVLDATDEMLECAASRRTNDEGKLLCKTLAKADALKAAKRFDAGDEDVPVVSIPAAGEDAPAVVADDSGEAQDGDDIPATLDDVVE